MIEGLLQILQQPYFFQIDCSKKGIERRNEQVQNCFHKSNGLCIPNIWRKSIQNACEDHNYGKINKPLFDAVAVDLAKLEKEELGLLFQRKEMLLKQYEETLVNVEFAQIISNGTAKIVDVRKKHEMISKLFEGIIKYSD